MRVYPDKICRKGAFLVVLAGVLTFSACNSSKSEQSSNLEATIVDGYTQIVFATYSDALLTATLLQTAVDSLLANPSEATLEAAKKAWLTSRTYYGQTEVFRFYDGPIDNGDNGVEGLLNAWPLDEVYVDYVTGAPDAGIINNANEYPEITKSLLVSLNEKGGEENISCGYHAIEFMLWGQDVYVDSPGKRPYQDFISGVANNDRRRTYLSLNCDLLIEHLTVLCDAWNPENKNNYAAQFKAAPVNESLQKILTGMGVLGKVEMAGERMFTAYDNASQEDEQSCFSDNTKADLMNNAGGVINVFFGTYVRYDKTNIQVPALDDLVKEKNQAVYDSTTVLLKKWNNQIQNIPQPFDVAIVDETKRPIVMDAILSSQQVGEQMATIAGLLGININVTATN
jgi:putative iron-regulated protein